MSSCAHIFKKISKIFSDIVFPPQCIACKTKINNENLLCGRCLSKITLRHGFACSTCGRRLQNLVPTCHNKEGFAILSATNYENDVSREIIYALKYKNIARFAGFMASLLKTCFEKNLFKFSLENFIAIPIPIYPKKARMRGYNQSELIAKKFLEKINYKIPLVTNNLIKTKNTKSQTDCKNYKEREENIRESFSVLKPEKINGKNVLIFDDVFTSGATMREAVKALKEAGAKKIVGIVFAKA